MDQDIKEIKLDETPMPPVATQKNRRKIIGITVGVVFLFLLFTVLIPLVRAYIDGKSAYAQALVLKDAVKSQDLAKIKTELDNTKTKIDQIKSDLGPMGWTGYIPFLGGYTRDAFAFLDAGNSGMQAGQILVSAVEPYADILGLKGQGSFTGGTAEERLTTAVETLDKVTPQIDSIAIQISAVRKSLDTVNPNRYPENFGGKPVRSLVFDLKQVIDLTDNLLTEARPMVKQLPELLGSRQPKKYMVLFQNDAELRPTGGFITAYAIFSIDKGKIHLETSDDIYKLDASMTKFVSPPDPIAKYLNVYGWRMRDSNFSPDFASSMKVFEDLYATTPSPQKLDGIIALDTQVLVKMVEVLGPIQAYGTNFTTQKVPQCDCPMIIYELEKYADQPTNYERGSRKDIIGVLLQTLMQKALSSPKTVYAPLFQASIEEAQQKHILLYLQNPDAQRGIEALGFGGRIKTYAGDYLHINDANLGGAKSNLYIVPSVKQDVTITDSGADETLTLIYKYPHAADNCSLERTTGLCLAGIYRDYVRIYLPKGTKIASVNGFESQSLTYEDLDHTAVDGFFTVVPQGLAMITIKYSIPGSFKKLGEYKSLIQKQPGTDGNAYTVIVNGKANIFNLTTDKELSVKL